jgi:hypothetical protein
MIHLYWRHIKPSDLDRLRIGLALCGKPFAKDLLTTEAKKATCTTCRERHERWVNSEEGKAMTESKILEEAMAPTNVTMTGPQIAAKYNEIAALKGKPQIKKFKNLEIARRRLAEIMALPRDEASEKPSGDLAKTKKKGKITKKNGLDPQAMITILKKDAYEGARKTKCGDNFNKLKAKEQCTVGDFLASIGTVGDLKYWRDKKGFIKIG